MMWRSRNRIGSDAGGALVELAVSLPVLALVLVGTIDFARVFYTAIALTNAARAGAQYGGQSIGSSADLPGITAAAATAAPNIGAFDVDAQPVTCRCATDDGSSFSAPQSCSDACTGGTHRVATVTVTTSKTFNLLASGFPGVPDNIDLSRTATSRVPGVAD